MSKWKEIPGLEPACEVCRAGLVRQKEVNCKGTVIENVIRHPTVHEPSGLRYLSFSENGKRVNRYVHRLVAEAFVDNPHGLKRVSFKDGDKRNCNARNLRWSL